MTIRPNYSPLPTPATFRAFPAARLPPALPDPASQHWANPRLKSAPDPNRGLDRTCPGGPGGCLARSPRTLCKPPDLPPDDMEYSCISRGWPLCGRSGHGMWCRTSLLKWCGFVEAALEIRTTSLHREIVCAIALDEAQIDSKDRANYIMSVAESGGLSVAVSEIGVQAFCCLDRRFFLGKPFISLLIVSSGARRQGLGSALLSLQVTAWSEVWTSTNRSNFEMRALLQKAGFRFCGELDGLDEGDPEQFFKFG